MEVIDALLMGLLQGLTEYLPVSSSGHLTIASHFFGIEGDANLAFTIAVHVATVFSTLVVLWKDIVWIFKGLFDFKPFSGGYLSSSPIVWISKGLFNFKTTSMNECQRYALNIFVSMIPVGIVGVFFKDYVEMIFGSGLLVVGLCLLLTATLLTFSYYVRPRQKADISLKDAFIIGLSQAIAVLPGLSRSGTTIATGLLLGNSKEKLAKFSFLMVIPPILGEALLDIVKGLTQGVEVASGGVGLVPLTVGFIAAFVSGCLACKWMINIVKKGKLVYFAIYCAIVGLFLIGHSLM